MERSFIEIPTSLGSATVDPARSFAAGPYLRTVLCAAVIMLFSAVLCEIIVDPKGLYGLFRKDGFNSYKIYQDNYAPEVKALAARRFRPDTVVFGASTVNRGIVPECQGSRLRNVSRIFNYGSSDAAAHTFLKAYDDVVEIGSLRRMVIEARFLSQYFSLNGHLILQSRSELPPRLNSGIDRMLRPWLPARFAMTYLANLFSWREIVLSLKTVAANRIPDHSTHFHGFAEDGSYDQGWLRRLTAWAITDQTVASHTLSYNDRFVRYLSNDTTLDFSYVYLFADAASHDGISLDFFITPEHGSELLLYRAAGIWPLYEDFKRGLLAAVEMASRRYAIKISLYDFGNLDEVTSQPVRAIGDRKVYDPYFGDPIHFRSIVGDFMLATILKCQTPVAVPDGFAVELDAQSVEPHLADERAKIDSYAQSHRELLQEISDAIHRRN
jgi:hypothetical protein